MKKAKRNSYDVVCGKKMRACAPIKVAILEPTIAPYRHPIFEKLSETIDLTVYYCSVKPRFRKWDLWPRNYSYKYKLLPRIAVGDFSINLSIVKEFALTKPDVIIIDGYVDPTMQLAFVIGKILKIPIIYWTEGIIEPRSILGLIIKPIRYLLARKSDACIAQGKRTKKYLESLGVNGTRTFVAHNCIDNQLFISASQEFEKSKDLVREQLGFQEKYLLLFVGQLIPRKGVFGLMKIYRNIVQRRKNVGLIILGSGPLRESLVDIVSKCELSNVHFIESGMSFYEMIKYYSISDIFVLPTLFDLAPLVINEAMACGLPVVVYDAAGNVDEFVIPNANGEIIETGDIEGFSESIIRILSDQNLRRKMAVESRRIVTSVGSVDSTVNRFLEAIKYAS